MACKPENKHLNQLTRREFAAAVMLAPKAANAAETAIPIAVRHVFDKRAKITPAQREWFVSKLWAEATRNFDRAGIELKAAMEEGEIRRSPAGRPNFVGLDYRAINVVVTDLVPMAWDHGRGLGGVTARWEGYDVCVISLEHARCHRVPFVSVNTCVHELLHVLLNDVRENKPEGWAGEMREIGVDWYATRLWLFGEGTYIRQSARSYLRRFS